MDTFDFPEVPANLLEALDRRFPERTPELSEGIDIIRYRSGQRSVVHMLRAIYEEQNETQSLEDSPYV
jgi:hypothetical protein